MKKILLLVIVVAVTSNTFSQQKTKTKEYTQEKTSIKLSAAKKDTIQAFTVDGKTALHSLMSLGDAHMLKLADDLKILAMTEVVRSGDWERMREPFAEVADMNVPAVYWFARPDGSYWTLDSGKVTSKLLDREYFPHLLAGQTVIGQLVVSHSTNRNTAVVAVPVQGPNNKIAGALGCSVHLDSLSAIIRNEMGGLEDTIILLFF